MPCPTATGSTALLLFLLPSSRQVSCIGVQQRRPSMLYPHHHGNPSTAATTTLPSCPPQIAPPCPDPPVFVSCSPQESYATTAAEHNNQRSTYKPKNKLTRVSAGRLSPLTNCVHHTDSGTFHSLYYEGQIFPFQRFLFVPIMCLDSAGCQSVFPLPAHYEETDMKKLVLSAPIFFVTGL